MMAIDENMSPAGGSSETLAGHGPRTGSAGPRRGRSSSLVVVPAYNEEHTIAGVIEGLRRAAPTTDRLIVTDGSRDATPAVVASMNERHLSLPGNVGYGCALQAGIRYALSHGYDVVVFLDGDGQHDPKYVPELEHALAESGCDVVIGSRFSAQKRYAGPLGRQFGQFVFSLVTRLLMGRRIYDTTSGLKAMTARACQAVLEGRFLDFHTEALVRLSILGFTICEHPIQVHERVAGRSMHSIASAVEYPVKTFFLTVVGIIDALSRRRPR